MIALEMQFKLQQKLQNHISMDLDIRTIDAEYYLNHGQDDYVDEIFKNYNGQEELSKRLQGLVVSTTLNTGSRTGVGIHPNSERWTIPPDVRYITEEFINTGTIAVKPVTTYYYNIQKNNPFKKPSSKVIWRMDMGNKTHELIGYNGLTISNYSLVYIKNPTEISILNTPNVDCEIAEEWHNEIIDKAVEFALESYQIAGSLRTRQE